MAITNLYPNLPGHLVEFKDGGMQLRETAVTGSSKSLLIIGTAIDGPVNEPVAVDVENVQKLFVSMPFSQDATPAKLLFLIKFIFSVNDFSSSIHIFLVY